MSLPFTSHRPRIAVLAGGDSSERAVSLESGRTAMAALRAGDYEPVWIDPSETPLSDVAWSRIDAALLALHGGAGEDGRIQRRLELLHVDYTGSGPSASRLAMSKSASKERFLQTGVPTLPYVLFHASDSQDDLASRLSALGFPLVIKPDGAGSSLGVSLARKREQLADAVTEAAKYDSFLLAEPLCPGRELTVGVLGRNPLPVLEIITPALIFDYQAKYQDVQTQFRFDTGLPDQVLDEVRCAALAAVEALGTRGLARVDLILDRQHRPWVLEVNTLPGLTTHSLVPQAAAHAGMDLSALCDWMVRDCLAVGANR